MSDHSSPLSELCREDAQARAEEIDPSYDLSAKRPLEFIAMDVLGTLPTTPRGNRFVLCIGDRFSKMAVAVALPEQTASIIAQAFMDRWVSIFGIPLTVLTDNGSAFASKFFQVLTRLLGIRQVFTSAYRPSTNGQIERWNATLVDTLTHIATQTSWDLNLGTACLSYNSSVHSSTGFAPVELACTRDPAPSVWTRDYSLTATSREEKHRFRHELLARAAKLCSNARETNLLRLERYKRIYDYHVKNRHKNLRIGDQVLLRTYMVEPGRSTKLSFPVSGPYPVSRIDGVNVEIRTKEGTERLHLDRVMRCPVDLPTGVAWAPIREPAETVARTPVAEDEVEYVIDRFISHARDKHDKEWLVRVRWAGYEADEDTWEPATALPANMLRRYEQRKKLTIGTLSN